MRVAIIGAGPTGLATAYDLAKGGHTVTVYEAEARVGGLAAGFKDAGWDWELEKFYHHWFESDSDLLHLAEELGVRDQVIFRRPKTSYRTHGRNVQLDGYLPALLYPYLSLFGKFRFALAGIYLRLTTNWRPFENVTADAWLRKWMGRETYELLWRPLLLAKFGNEYDKVTMTWMWARIHARSTKLGTFVGGFQRFMDTFADRVRALGVTIRLGTPISEVTHSAKGLTVSTLDGQSETYERVLSTASPTLTLKLVPELANTGDYADRLRSLKSIGAVCVVLALHQPLLTDGTYWLNLPATSPDRNKNEFPFLALVEHTHFMDAAHYNGDQLIYLGDYVPVDHEYFRLTDEQLTERFTASLTKFNPAFKPDWIRKAWVFRAPYAQPVPYLNHSAHLPDTKTPIDGLYLASMSQVYPWDRGTNYAIGLGRAVAKRIIANN